MAEERPHLSASQLEMFWRCPEQYRRRYIEGEKLPPGIALIAGKAFHKGAEVNFTQKIESHEDLPTCDIADAAASAFDAEVAGGYTLNEDEESKGAKKVLGEAKDQAVFLARVHSIEQAPDYQPVAVEHKTRILFPSSTHDLLAVTDLRDDKDRVVDLKTAARKMPVTAADESTQLTIYAAAFHADVGRAPSEVRLDVLTKTKAPQRQVLQSERNANDFRVFANRVNVTLSAIKAGSFTPASPGAWCCSPKWCGFWNSCPYINAERRAAADKGE